MVEMKAVGLYKYLPIHHSESLIDITIPKPKAEGRDILVKVNAISINPVDVKVRAPKDKQEETPKILGWDASGIVEEVGEDCKLFKPGDQVYYAGSITRPGTYSEYHLVDERIVGKKPETLNDAQAAALPLTAITAWEGLFERLGIDLNNTQKNKERSILIIGGAGGVGSIAIQLAKLAGLTVISTASQQESINWCKKLGSDYVINHYKPFVEQLEEINLKGVDYIFCLNNTDQHWDQIAASILPQGKICSIVETAEKQDLNVLKSKSATFVWEFMFTRAMFQTEDMQEQHQLLSALSEFIDQKRIVTTLTDVLRPINAENLKKAHGMVESGKMVGKVVIEHFE